MVNFNWPSVSVRSISMDFANLRLKISAEGGILCSTGILQIAVFITIPLCLVLKCSTDAFMHTGRCVQDVYKCCAILY